MTAKRTVLGVLLLIAATLRASGAEAQDSWYGTTTVWMALTIDGTDVEAEPNAFTDERQTAFPLTFFSWGVDSQRSPLADPSSTGGREYRQIVVRRRVDSASPTLIQRAFQNYGDHIVEATFYFFRVDPETAVEGLIYTVEIGAGDIAAVANTLAPDGTFVEEVSFTFQQITVVYPPLGIQATDTVSD